MVETEYFADGTVPTEYCDHHVSATICSASGLLANEFCPEETKQTGIYIIGGSGNSGDGEFLLPSSLEQGNYCTVHTAASILPEIPEIPILDEQEETNNDKKPDKDDKKEDDEAEEKEESDDNTTEESEPEQDDENR